MTTITRKALQQRHKDPTEAGLWFRVKSDGSKVYGFNSLSGSRVTVGTRDEAIVKQAEDKARKYSGLPSVDRSVRIRDLVAEVRATQRDNVRATTLAVDERGLDMIEKAIGHLLPSNLIGSDALDRFVADVVKGKVTGKPVAVSTAKRYLHVLRHVEKIALKRGLLPHPVYSLIAWPKPQVVVDEDAVDFAWTPETVNSFLAASEALGARDEAQYDYSPLFRLLAFTGARIGEVLALKVKDADLLAGTLRIRRTLYRDGSLAAPKTESGRRTVSLGSALVSLLVEVIPADADPESFIFHAKGDPTKPLAYGNVRRRGWAPAAAAAGLPEDVTIHTLRGVVISLARDAGLDLDYVSTMVGHADRRTTERYYLKRIENTTKDDALRAFQDSLAA